MPPQRGGKAPTGGWSTRWSEPAGRSGVEEFGSLNELGQRSDALRRIVARTVDESAYRSGLFMRSAGREVRRLLSDSADSLGLSQWEQPSASRMTGMR